MPPAALAQAHVCAIIPMYPPYVAGLEIQVEIFVAKWLPFLYFRRQGRVGAAVAALLMQLTIVLWPIASFWAMGHAVKAQESDRWYALYRRDF